MIQCQANASINGDARSPAAIDCQAKVAPSGMFRRSTLVALALQTLPTTQIYGADGL